MNYTIVCPLCVEILESQRLLVPCDLKRELFPRKICMNLPWMASGTAICCKIVSGSHVNSNYGFIHIIALSIYQALWWSLLYNACCLKGQLDIVLD